MEPFTPTLAVRFMNKVDSHSVNLRGTPNSYIFIRSPVGQELSYARLRLKKVAMVRQRLAD